jgi:hypothetical protein
MIFFASAGLIIAMFIW